MRICSFLPSATEILYELDLGNHIVGVTHACNFPPAAKGKTVVVRSIFDDSILTSKEIDNLIVKLECERKDVYVVDDNALKNASPDLIIAQGLCDVCSPHKKELDRAMNILNNKPEVIMLNPDDLDGIIFCIDDIAKKVGKEQKGKEIIASMMRRIDNISSKAKAALNKPKVLCIEWLDPLFTSGHWVPQMVDLSGAINGISKTGERSRRMELREVMEFDPDIIILMPCGFNIERTMNEIWQIERIEEWKNIRAVKMKEVYATEASPYFSRPGPRTVVGIEILAKIIHPELFTELKVPENSYTKIY